ncbi:MAG: Ig-like domain-containing protein [Oscillospiraceae bacterium]|jgi:uncharacterized protein YjdB|nr:Ig-like domain-containing protein [Oscillospiraceae bacterium]
MKFFKRLTSLALVLTLAVPYLFVGEAAALSGANYGGTDYTPEAWAGKLSSVNAAYGSSPFTSSFNPGSVPSSTPSWAYAAAAVLNARVTGLSDSYEPEEIKGPAQSNRSILASYLLRDGGPKPEAPVSGVVYIPDPEINNTTSKKAYIKHIKDAVSANRAVALSFYYDPKMRFDEHNGHDDVYDNSRNTSANHTVVVVGWDDTKTISHYIGDKDGVQQFETRPALTPAFPDGGAFLVYDSNNPGFTYWVSYNTLLTGAYYIEGYYSATKDPSVSADFKPHTPRRNKEAPYEYTKFPINHTYQYDTNGISGVRETGQSTALYANVFSVAGTASVIQGVSVFLPVENSTVEDIYIIQDYKKDKDFETLLSAYTGDPLDAVTIKPGVTTTKPLPGYYTFPIDPVVLEGKQFAVVVKVSTTLSGVDPSVPLQKSASGSNSYYFDGAKWNKLSGQAVCIKALAENDVDVGLTGVEVADTDNKVDDLTVAPGGMITLKPLYIPFNASDVIPNESVIGVYPVTDMVKWEVEMTYYERDSEGYIDESVVTKDPISGDYEAVSQPADWLIWNSTFGIFARDGDLPSSKPTTTTPAWKADQARVSDGSGGWNIVTVSNYVEQMVTKITVKKDGTADAVFSKNEKYYTPASSGIQTAGFRVTVHKGERDSDGKFKDNGLLMYDPAVPVTSAVNYVGIKATLPAVVKLSKTSASLKAGGTTTLTAKQYNSEGNLASGLTLKWYVLDNETGNKAGFTAYDPSDPYNGPVAFVDDKGKVTALREGTCWVYAEAGTVQSDACQIAITGAAATGVTINKKKMTMSMGTASTPGKLTLTATVKPAGASDKRVKWSSSDADVAEVDENSGIITAKKPGVTTITVTSVADSAFTATCVLTVSAGPSATIKKSKSATYSVLGAASNATVEWRFNEDLISDSVVKNNDYLTIANSGTAKCKVTAKKPDPAVDKMLKGTVKAKQYDVDGNVIKEVVIREQTWRLEPVVAISKMEFRDANGNLVKKLTLCISEDGSISAETATLSVKVVKPSDATLLDFEWIPKQIKDKSDKTITYPMLEADSASPGTVTIKGLIAGSAKLTALNYNGNKKVNLSVKVLYFPSQDQIKPKKDSLTLYTGKSTSVKAKVTGKNVNKALTYTLDPAGTDVISLDTKKAKITAKKEGTARVIITGAGGKTQTVTVEVTTKPAKGK